MAENFEELAATIEQKLAAVAADRTASEKAREEKLAAIGAKQQELAHSFLELEQKLARAPEHHNAKADTLGARVIDRFGPRHPDPGGIEPGRSVDACLPVRDRGVAERVFRKRILEVIRPVVIGCAIHSLLVRLRGVHHHVLCLEGVRIRVAADDEGAVRSRPRPHEERRARVCGA